MIFICDCLSWLFVHRTQCHAAIIGALKEELVGIYDHNVSLHASGSLYGVFIIVPNCCDMFLLEQCVG